MGEAAVTEPTPATTPAVAPEPSASPAPSGGAGEGSSAQPTEGAKPPDQLAAPAEPALHVPYARFREVQTAHTRMRREYDTAREQWQRDLAEAKAEVAAKARFEKDYAALEGALRAHPDIAEMLRERLGSAPARPATGVQPPQAPIVDPKLQAEVGELAGYVRQLRAQQAQQQEQQANHQLRQELHTSLKKELAGKGYNEKFLPQAEAYILQRVSSPEMADATVDDVPYLFAEWYKLMEGAFQERLSSLVNGKREDARTIPATPGGQVPILPAVKPGGLDADASKALEEALAQRGWNNTGA
jgi:hypothetical protein